MRILARNPNYGVTEDGKVFSVALNRELSPKRNHDGYLRIQLWEHGKCHFVSIHRLIAETFIPNPGGKPFVNHIDGNKQNNRVDNLEWCTQRENIRHAWTTGLSKSHKNKNGKRVKQLTREGELVRIFPSTMEVERVLGIKHTNISAASRRGGTSFGFRWEVMDS